MDTSSQRNLAACDPESGALVLCDDLELLVHGAGEEPLWRATLEAPIVGVGAGGGHVVSLDASGRVAWWQAGGARAATHAVPDEPLGLAVSRDGERALVLLRDRVALVERAGALRFFPADGLRSASFSWDGRSFALGGGSAVRVLSLDGALLGATPTEAPAASLAASPRGFFYATVGDRVLRVQPGGGEAARVTRAGGFALDCVAASDDGALFAVRLDAKTVIALGDPPGETVVQLVYVDKDATGVAFGPDRVLCVALSEGDANYADIPGKQLRRSDTFDGRAHHRWLVRVVIEPSAAPPPAAPAPSAPAPAPAPPAPAAPEGKRFPLGAALFLAAFFVGLLALAWVVLGDQPKKKTKEQRMRDDVERSVKDSLERQKRK